MEGNKNDQEVRGSFVGEPWGTDPSSLGRGRKALIKHRPIVPAIQELRQEDHKLKTRLGYGIQSRASWVAVRPYPPSPKEDS